MLTFSLGTHFQTVSWFDFFRFNLENNNIINEVQFKLFQLQQLIHDNFPLSLVKEIKDDEKTMLQPIQNPCSSYRDRWQ